MPHRFEEGKSEALVQARKREHRCRRVQGRERRLVHVAEVADPGLGSDALQRVAVCPSRATRDDQLGHAGTAVDDERQRAPPASELPISRKQARVVLAWLDGADGEDVSRLDAVGQRTGRYLRWSAFWNHLDLLLQPLASIPLEKVSARQ